MPFREKSAWIALVSLVVTFGTFAALRGRVHGRGEPLLFFGCLAAFVALRVVLHFIAKATAPDDARAPLDERERLIGFKATRNANIALFLGVLVIPLQLHTGGSKFTMAYLAMAAIVAGEIVREISRITYFREGR